MRARDGRERRCRALRDGAAARVRVASRLRQTELVTRATLAGWGDNPYVAALGPERQARVLRRSLFVLELNQRAWGEIARFYGAQPELRLHGPFGRPLAPA
jgi:hypothetical protein